ncbi:cation-transporting ATPase [Ligilactobacillus salitolerans]|uniref:Cation-transporting ATPase n=1 Tax=Ligilactobacillus salitolerans TaxID=1808352 RepID=A0A401IQE1_9LACO|nr:cation-translocating P-type ATPase [Ligilactobacillus salitolerans]GBG93751.1 cation-transporting ATPase [Ligilactobacillus salitolerans]
MPNLGSPSAKIYARYRTSQEGLTEEQVIQRSQDGLNELQEKKGDNLFKKIIGHFSDVASLVLLFAVLLSTYLAATGSEKWSQPLIIGSILVLNVAISLYQEHSAEKALDALKNLNVPESTVIRDGEHMTIRSKELVVGDLVILSGGDQVPADGRLLTANNLSINESILTGESEPVEKTAVDQEPTAEISLRFNEVFSGTDVIQGTGVMVVTAIGMETELGEIAGLLNTTEKQKTPLQEKLNTLSKKLTSVALAGGLLIFIIGFFFRGFELSSGLIMGVSLAVAAVPETLPIIVTISLSYGVVKMSKKNAIMRRMNAVETLGGVDVIASDKTGTLTQNQMTVTKYWTPNEQPAATAAKIDHDSPEFQLMRFMGLATDAQIKEVDGEKVEIGDSTELAIIRWLQKAQTTRAELEQEYPRVAEDPFDSNKKLMATLHKTPYGKYLLIVKGAIDRLPAELTNEEHRQVDQINQQFAKEALRVLSVGYALLDEKPALPLDATQTPVKLAGLIGIIDPPRPQAISAIKTAKRAGITTLMITGDHPETAKAIAVQMGIAQADAPVMSGQDLRQLSDEQLQRNIQKYTVYARVSPEDKIRIVKAWQANNSTVAMTGDGVNDAPALKAADVGIAMGITGTDVSKQAADMILTDDNFETIVAAVEEGRTIYQNILKAVEFLIGVNFAQLLLMIIAVAAGWGSPLLAEQLLLINVLADGIPGFYLSREPAEDNNMDKAPIKRKSSIFADGLAQRVAFRAAAFTILTLVIFVLGFFVLSDQNITFARTMLFLTLALGSMIDIYVIKSRQQVSPQTLISNSALNLGLATTMLAITLIAAVPGVREVFEFTGISGLAWLIVIISIFIPALLLELNKRYQLRKLRKEEPRTVRE